MSSSNHQFSGDMLDSFEGICHSGKLAQTTIGMERCPPFFWRVVHHSFHGDFPWLCYAILVYWRVSWKTGGPMVQWLLEFGIASRKRGCRSIMNRWGWFHCITHWVHVWYIYLHLPPKRKTHVGKYAIHGSYGLCKLLLTSRELFKTLRRVFVVFPSAQLASMHVQPRPWPVHVLNCTRKAVPSTFVKRCAGYMASSPMQRTFWGWWVVLVWETHYSNARCNQ